MSDSVTMTQNDAMILLSWAARGLAIAKRLKFSDDMINKADMSINKIKLVIEEQTGEELLLIKWSD